MLNELMDFVAAAGPDGWTLAGAGLVAGGLSVGVVSLIRGSGVRSEREHLAVRLDEFRQKYSASSSHLRFVRKASFSLKALPAFEFEGATFGAVSRPLEARGNPSDIVQELAESLNHNISSSISITDLIIDGDLERDSDRKKIASDIKSEAKNLDPSFWGRHGKMIEGSDLPPALIAEIKKFYVEVATLKQGAGKLSSAPSADDILAVGLKAVDVLQCAAAIYDIIETQSLSLI